MQDWTAAEWSKVIFSDEKKFGFFLDVKIRVSEGERAEVQNPRCVSCRHLPATDRFYGYNVAPADLTILSAVVLFYCFFFFFSTISFPSTCLSIIMC